MKEKNFQKMFGTWIKENEQATTAFELKICKLKSLSFDSVKEHQVEALVEAKHGYLYHKISDSPIFPGHKTRFTKPKPFDCLVISESKAYVVIWYYHPRQPKEMIWIDINDWLKEVKASDRKSLTEERAKEIGKVIKFK